MFLKQVLNQTESFNKVKEEEKLWAEHMISEKIQPKTSKIDFSILNIGLIPFFINGFNKGNKKTFGWE